MTLDEDVLKGVVNPASKSTMKESDMAHKKIERKKEIDRRRKRRAERAKDRVRELKAAKKA